MQLTRLRLEQVRQFRRPLELRFAPGLNLVHGPNESGKSTLVRGIRAAFFERHRSSSVDDLCPWNDSSAVPNVALDFEWQGETWRLTKSFLRKKRCDLQVGNKRFEGEEAEDRLAGLLGFQFPGRGGSKEEHWGIPGLLWVEQGRGQDLHEAVTHAGGHLKNALDGLLGEVASSGGDELLRAVKAQRDELLTGATSRPKGEFAEVERDLVELRRRLAELDERIHHYQTQVDSLGALRAQQRQTESERPWEALQRDYEDAQRRQADVAAWQEAQQRDQQALESCRQTLVLLRQQRAQQEALSAKLTERRGELERAEQHLEEVQASGTGLQAALETAKAVHATARVQLRRARQQAERRRRQEQLSQAEERLQTLMRSVEQAQACERELQQTQSAWQQAAIDPAAVKQLKAAQETLSTLRLRCETRATRLRYRLEPGQSLQLEGRALAGQGEELLLEERTLDLPGLGSLRIAPGGEDLGKLRRELQRQQEDLTQQLAALQVVSLEEAEARLQRRQETERDLRALRQRLALLAPEGVAALTASRQAEARQVEALRAALQASGAEPVMEPSTSAERERGGAEQANAMGEFSLQEAEAAEAAAEVRLQHAEKALHAYRQQVALAEQSRDSAQREWRQLQQEAENPQRLQLQDDLARQILESADREASLQRELEARQQRIDAANPQLIQQDIERLGRSIEQVQESRRQRQLDIVALQSALESQGAQGLEEERAALREQLERSVRRHQELQRRAQALDLLLSLLQDKRQQLTQRLQAPLQKHLQHYLSLLFPGARLEVDEQLKPNLLTRPAQDGSESGELGQLSFGAREQLGLISRLAYADLLREAGRPTLILLDDSLVHSDKTRLARMQRVLYDAAQRHQILLFSCHPENWVGLGAVNQDLLVIRGG